MCALEGAEQSASKVMIYVFYSIIYFPPTILGANAAHTFCAAAAIRAWFWYWESRGSWAENLQYFGAFAVHLAEAQVYKITSQGPCLVHTRGQNCWHVSHGKWQLEMVSWEWCDHSFAPHNTTFRQLEGCCRLPVGQYHLLVFPSRSSRLCPA